MTRYEVELTDEQARRVLSLVDQEIATDVEKALAPAILANPPKPPRMAEPDWGEKVIAHCEGEIERRPWIRWNKAYASALNLRWSDGTQIRQWDDLIEPEPWRADS